MDTTEYSSNQRCTICGTQGPVKACSSCTAKYRETYDLTTPDGRYQARVAEQGTSADRWRTECERLEKLDALRKPLVDKLSQKLAAATDALQDRDYAGTAAALKGVELLSKKLRSIL